MIKCNSRCIKCQKPMPHRNKVCVFCGFDEDNQEYNINQIAGMLSERTNGKITNIDKIRIGNKEYGLYGKPIVFTCS